MTPEEELALLIEEQRQDDTYVVWPERGADFSLDASVEGVDGGVGSMGSALGVIYDFAGEVDGDPDEPFVVSFLPRRRGYFMGRHIPHGTTTGYVWHGCRCSDCTAANSVAHLDWHNRRRAAGHGRYWKYARGCRCAECTSAWKKYHRRKRGSNWSRRKCYECGAWFKPGPKCHKAQKFCSRACSNRLRAREHYRRKNNVQKPRVLAHVETRRAA